MCNVDNITEYDTIRYGTAIQYDKGYVLIKLYIKEIN